jgi:hypothetical protein
MNTRFRAGGNPRRLVVRMAVCTMVAALPLAGQDVEQRGRVVGRVVDEADGRGLARAMLEVVGTDLKGPASPDGRFMFPPLTAGPITVEVSHAGYEPRTERIEIVAGATVEVRIGLATSPSYRLEPVAVRVRSAILERRGFYQRQAQGYSGVFLSRADIAERGPQNVTEMFEGIPGLKVLPGGLEGARVVFQRAISFRDSGVCAPALFLDGTKSQIRIYDAIVDPSHVEGIEVYRGTTVPGQFNDPCGAILIWTRVPG